MPCRAERFWGQLPRSTSPRLVPHGSSSLRSSSNLSIPTIFLFLLCVSASAAPCSSLTRSCTSVHSLVLFPRKTRHTSKTLRKKEMKRGRKSVCRRLARRFALHPHGFAKRVVLAPCSVVRSVEYDSTLLRSLPSQNATSAQTAPQKAYVVSNVTLIRGNRNNRRHPPPAHGCCCIICRNPIYYNVRILLI